MYIRHHNNNEFVTADVYPHAAEDADPRFLSVERHFAVLPEGDILYNGGEVTVEGIAKDAGEMILAAIAAEQIVGATADRSVLRFLAESLIAITKQQ